MKFSKSCVFLTVALMGTASAQTTRDAVPVEPSELERREDLVGKAVVVDDHVRFYVNREGQEPDELELKRTSVIFYVPRALRPPPMTRLNSALVYGVLKKNAGRVVCEVTAIKPVSGDLDRLSRGLASLPAKDFETRKAWARWAERRAREFKDPALLDRARSLEAEALRIEAEMMRVGVDAPREWLNLAQDARRRNIPEPEPSALGHRALKAIAGNATTVAALERAIAEISAFFPAASTDLKSARVNLAEWEGPYAANPAETYRNATPTVRQALDRRLWADTTTRLFELRGAEDLQTALTLADQAMSKIPEKPTLATTLLEQGTRMARQNLGTLRLSEVKALATVYREKLQKPEVGLEILGDWLKIQRDRLSATDADGPVELANLYEELLQDRVTSVELLRKAWKIDPSSKEIAEAFRTRGFRKIKDDWVDASTAPSERTKSDAGILAAASALPAKGLRGLSSEEVRARLGGNPDRINYVASKGQLIEQWIYHLDTKQVRFVNLLHSPGDLKPRVIADYTIAVTTLKGGARPPR
jgi:tetratricopeptide (TPR) repeat protein